MSVRGFTTEARRARRFTKECGEMRLGLRVGDGDTERGGVKGGEVMWKRVWERVGSTGVDRAVGVWVVMWLGYEMLWGWGGEGVEYWSRAGGVVVFWLGCGLVVTRWVRVGVVVGLVGVLGLELWAMLTGGLVTSAWTEWVIWVSRILWESLLILGAAGVLVWQGVVGAVGEVSGSVTGEVEAGSLNYARGEAWGGFDRWLAVWVLAMCAVLGFGGVMGVVEMRMSLGGFAEALRQFRSDAWELVGALVGMGIAGGSLMFRKGAGWAVVAMGVVGGVSGGWHTRETLRMGWVEAGRLEYWLQLAQLIAPGVLVGMLWWESRRRGR